MFNIYRRVDLDHAVDDTIQHRKEWNVKFLSVKWKSERCSMSRIFLGACIAHRLWSTAFSVIKLGDSMAESTTDTVVVIVLFFVFGKKNIDCSRLNHCRDRTRRHAQESWVDT
jgi:hypothetical protein